MPHAAGPFQSIRSLAHCVTLVFLAALACLGMVASAAPPASAPGTICVVPQSHIDVVWLWRFDPETIHRCCKPTFTRALNNLAQFPDYIFCQSQVPLYEATERVYPELFAKIQQYIREGRWEIVGGMYVEPEGGEPGGEALVRQCVLGKRYFRARFGVDVTTGWQADAWTHPAQLPQIMAKSGMDAFMFLRGSKGEHLFWWESPDGSRVLACKPLDHVTQEKWPRFLQSIKERYGVNTAMIEMGGGDHGGGMSAEQIQEALDFSKSQAPDTKVVFSTFRNYADTVLAQNPKLPVIPGELGFELQGDLTNCGEIKKSNRDCENGLLSAEKWASLAHAVCGFEYPFEELEESWKKLLFNQFHDILGGSLIPPAIADAMVQYQSVRDSVTAVTDPALRAFAKHIDTHGPGTPVIVYNALPWTRTDLVEVDIPFAYDPGPLLCLDRRQDAVPVQVLGIKQEKDERYLKCLFLAKDVPSLGYAVYHVVPQADVPDKITPALEASDSTLENATLRVELDPASGWVRRIYDKAHHREVLDESGMGNQLIAIEDDGDSEGRFVVHDDKFPYAPGKAGIIDSPPSISLEENGPVRATLLIKRTFRDSCFVQRVSLAAGLSRADFALDVDWHDEHIMIKTAFPMAVKKPVVTYDTPYAAVTRPADGHEYPAQKWVDMGGRHCGVSLLNDARYAHDAQGNVLRMSVLRSPDQPARNTDEGPHHLGYAIYPHEGSWKEGGTYRQAYAFNYRLQAIADTVHDGDWPEERSFVQVNPGNVLLEAVKKPYDGGGLLLRLCEMHGQKSTVHMTLPAAVGVACETDLLETPGRALNADGATLSFSINPYEIKTIKLEMKTP